MLRTKILALSLLALSLFAILGFLFLERLFAMSLAVDGVYLGQYFDKSLFRVVDVKEWGSGRRFNLEIASGRLVILTDAAGKVVGVWGDTLQLNGRVVLTTGQRYQEMEAVLGEPHLDPWTYVTKKELLPDLRSLMFLSFSYDFEPSQSLMIYFEHGRITNFTLRRGDVSDINMFFFGQKNRESQCKVDPIVWTENPGV